MDIGSLLFTLSLGAGSNALYDLSKSALVALLSHHQPRQTLQSAVVTAFESATKQLAEQWAQGDARIILLRLQKDSTKLFPIESDKFPTAVLTALLTNDLPALQQATWTLIEQPYLASEPDVRDAIKAKLPPQFNGAFYELLQSDRYQGTRLVIFHALLQEMIRRSHTHFEQLRAEQQQGTSLILTNLSKLAQDPDLMRQMAESLAALLKQAADMQQALHAIVEYLFVHLGSSDPQLAVVLDQYRTWVKQRTAFFSVPGFDKPLPIENAWDKFQILSAGHKALRKAQEEARPQTLAAKLAAYHEWERLSHQDQAAALQDPSELSNHLVVIGGPGSGKSTWCKKATHQLSLAGKHVLWVRLPFVAKRYFQKGERFDEAVLQAALDGSAIQAALVQTLLDPPDCLLADGLDECDPHQKEIADLINTWALARPHTRVIVTTRPIGYSPAYFSGWEHAEILPLASDQIEVYARHIIATDNLIASAEVAAEKAHQFHQRIKSNRTASMAARSPLLLGFLVRLFLANIPFPQKRALLYQRVLELWRQTADEHSKGAPEPDALLAHRALDIIGWLLKQTIIGTDDGSERKIIEQLARQLADDEGCKPLAVSREAHECLSFWERHGVLEHLQVGTEETYTFIHATLGEYAAGRYASQLDEVKFAEWLGRVRRNARWREPILLAAGDGAVERIVKHLLSLDTISDPVATESLLAAAALDEVEAPPPDLVAAVIEHLAARLVSSISLVACESANHMVGLATQAPHLIAPLLKPLFNHPQVWTRLAAIRLALTIDTEMLDLDVLEACLDNGPAVKDVRSRSIFGVSVEDILREEDDWKLWNEVVTLGAKLLADRRPGPETIQRVRRVAQRNLSFNTPFALIKILKDLGGDEAAVELEKRFLPLLYIPWEQYNKKERLAEKALLRAIIQVTGESPLPGVNQREPVTLAKLLLGLGLDQVDFRQFFTLANQSDLAAVNVVLVGAIAALGLDRAELAADAMWALTRLQKRKSSASERTTLLNLIPKIPQEEPDWDRASTAKLPAEALVQALCHPCGAISVGAANLLATGVGGRDVPQMLADLLYHDNDNALHLIALIAQPIWGDAAPSYLLDRLEQEFSLGCRWLIIALLPLLEKATSTRIQQVLMRGLMAEDERIAATIADKLPTLEITTLTALVPKLWEVLRYWTQHADYCYDCQLPIRGSCPQCHKIPSSPRRGLIQALSACQVISLQDWLQFCWDEDHEIARTAGQELIKILSIQPMGQLVKIIQGVAAGQYPFGVLQVILALPPTQLAQVQEEVLMLLQCKSAVIRGSIVKALVRSRWLSHEQAVYFAREALQDSILGVREQAVITLRALEESGI